MGAVTELQRRVLQLLEEFGPVHVYELKRQMGSRSTYATVVSLQARGLVEARWEPSEYEGKPPRKIVSLTGIGEQALRETVRPRQTFTAVFGAPT